MITPELVKKRKSEKFTPQCAICAGVSVKILRLGSNFAVVCKNCLDTFSLSDLELMHNLFLAYGGYFGKYASSKEESYQELVTIAKEFAQSGRDIKEVGNDAINLHRAFTHGITPIQLIKGLRVLSD